MIAVALAGVWAATKVDALLLGVAIQLILMVKQLSPVIRADGYHILADATASQTCSHTSARPSDG